MDNRTEVSKSNTSVEIRIGKQKQNRKKNGNEEQKTAENINEEQ